MKSTFKAAAFGTAFIAAILSGQAQADAWCILPLNNVSLYPDGTLNVGAISGLTVLQWKFCNLSGSSSVNTGYAAVTVTADTCKGLYSQFLTARSADKAITFWFHGPANCGAASLPGNDTTPSPSPVNIIF